MHVERDGRLTPKLLDFGVVRVLPRGEASARLRRYAAICVRAMYAASRSLAERRVFDGPRALRCLRAKCFTTLLALARSHAQLRANTASDRGASGPMSIISRAVAKELDAPARRVLVRARAQGDRESFSSAERKPRRNRRRYTRAAMRSHALEKRTPSAMKRAWSRTATADALRRGLVTKVAADAATESFRALAQLRLADARYPTRSNRRSSLVTVRDASLLVFHALHRRVENHPDKTMWRDSR